MELWNLNMFYSKSYNSDILIVNVSHSSKDHTESSNFFLVLELCY